MNIRDAILKAADHIERNPREFDYWSTNTPEAPGRGTPGCALGWVACFMGESIGALDSSWNRAMRFYSEMDSLAHGWMSSAPLCAKGLRLYADKYHPAESPAVPVAYPDWMAIARGDVKCVEGA
jgi:hypothetical protein